MTDRDLDLDGDGPGCALAVLISIGFVLAVGLGLIVLVAWAGHRDETGMARVETVATTTSSTTSTTAPEVELEPRGWPADWLSEREIGLIAWSLHLDHLAEAEAEVDASSMAIEQQPSGEIVVTNPPEAPVADDAIRSIICDGRTWDCDTAMRVARCESNYNAHAVGRQGERGWFQIWAKWHMDRIGRLGFTPDDLFDPVANTAVAYDLWRADGWRHWSCAR